MSEREQRIEELIRRFETALERLESVAGTATLPPPPRSSEPRPAASTPSPRPGIAPAPPERSQILQRPLPKPAPPAKTAHPRPDAWRVLRYVGVALLLLGTAFLFNYVEDEPRGLMWLRVATAFGIGAGLIAVGWRLSAREPQFSQVLSGGGTGVWFITGFAAYQTFGLIPAPVGLAWIAIVSLACFALSVRQNAESLALIGTIGGLGTPFLFEASIRGPAGAVVFVLAVAGCAVSIHVHRGWRPLLWTTLATAWGAMALCVRQHAPELPATGTLACVVLEFGIGVLWLVSTVVPVWREAASFAAPDRWPRPSWLKKSVDIQVIMNLVPLAGMVLTASVWDLDKKEIGWVALGAALGYSAAVLWTRKRTVFAGFRPSLYEATVMLWTLAVCLALEGNTMRFALATEAAILLRIGRESGRPLTWWGHALFFVLGAHVLYKIAIPTAESRPLLNERGLADLYTLIAGVVASLWVTRPDVRSMYRYPAHAFFLILVWREFNDGGSGAGVVSAIWGLYSIVLVVLGVQRQKPRLRTVGLATVFIVVGKLILVDLSEVRAIWRVLLFLGFGGALLWLSYYFHKMVPAQEREPE